MLSFGNIARVLVLVAAGGATGAALAQGSEYAQGPGGSGYGPGRAPGMMGAYGGPGVGHHHDMGPGMRGGYGPGPGYGAQRFGPGERMGDGRGAGRMFGRMARVLGLSEDQRAKARRIMEDTRRKNWDVIGQIRSERFNLREMMRADRVDPDAAVEQKRKIDDLRRQIMRARLEARNQVLALLTPEQREKARALRQLRRERRGNG